MTLTREQQIALMKGAEERQKNFVAGWLKRPEIKATLRRQARAIQQVKSKG